MDIITVGLISIIIMTNLVLIFIGFVLLRLTRSIEQLENRQYIPIVVPQPGKIVTVLDVDVLAGGSLKFTLEDGEKAVFDLDGNSIFNKMPGEELIVTFQKKV